VPPPAGTSPSGSPLPGPLGARRTSRPPAAPSHIKGFAIERILHWYAKQHGDEKVRELVLALPLDMLGVLDLDHHTFGVIASEWYPAPLVHRVFDDMARGLDGAAREEFVRGGAEAVVRAGLRGVHKVLFQLFMNPTRYASRAQSLWERYYDTGTMEKTIEGPGRHHTTLRDWTSHHPLLCEINAHSARIVYQELGCRNVNVERTGCVSRGHLACTQVITWDA
jgi:hypothetical protein